MIKIVSILIMLTSFFYASDMAPTTQNIRSYPLNENNIYIRTDLQLVSKDLDIFNIRDENNGKAISHGAIGDLTGTSFSFGYGYKEHISLFYNLSFLNFDYASETLKNSSQDIFVKLNIYNNPSSFLNTLSTDIGISHNGSNDLNIKNSNLNIKKITDLSDNSFYIRAISGTKINSSILDFYFGLKYSKINTKLDNKSYDRTEFAYNGGFQYTLELGRYLIETGYEYIKLFNRHIKTSNDKNHIFNLSVSYAINNQLIIFIGSKLLNHQFNGIIPYLHNEKTIDTFDQKYGYGSIGFVYNFNI